MHQGHSIVKAPGRAKTLRAMRRAMPQLRRVFEGTRCVREKTKMGLPGTAPLQQSKAWRQCKSGKSQRAHQKHQRTEASERKPSQASPVTPAKASHASTPSQSQTSAHGQREPPDYVCRSCARVRYVVSEVARGEDARPRQRRGRI